MDELLRIVGDQDAALFAVRDVLKLDKSIYSKILRIANSVAHREGIVERISETHRGNAKDWLGKSETHRS